MIGGSCDGSKQNIERLIMMTSRGICVSLHGGAHKNANAFVLADQTTSTTHCRGLYDHLPTDLWNHFYQHMTISSHIRIQMAQELVRLIDLIYLNIFSTYIVHRKSSESFYGRNLSDPPSKSRLKWPFLPMYKSFQTTALRKRGV